MKSPNNLSFYESLSYCTSRITCYLEGNLVSTGTGFFLNLKDESNKDEEARHVLVTNKHVVEGAIRGNLTISYVDKGLIQPTTHFDIPVDNFESLWTHHPNEDVDLCCMEMNTIKARIKDQFGVELFYEPLSINMIPGFNNERVLDSMEEVIMIGYPDGIWDSQNNKPIFRKGITATDFNLDYNGEKEYLIDMAVFGGSSGSPILSVWEGFEQQIDGNLQDIRRAYIMGILYAGFESTVEGEIKIVEIPKLKSPIAQTSIPNNLGVVIKPNELISFRDLIK